MPSSQPTPPRTPEPGGLTFAAFQKVIKDRYYATDSAPGKTPTPEERANLDEEFADVIAWLTTLANINGVDLEKALGKYTITGVAGVKD